MQAAHDSSSQTSVLDAFQVELLSTLAPYMEDVRFSESERLFEEGDPSDSFYVVHEGAVRLEVKSPDVDAENVVDFAGPGSFVGLVSLLSAAPHSTSGVADTDVTARRLSSTALKRLFDEDPDQGIAVLRAMGRDMAIKYRDTLRRLAEHLGDDAPDPEVDRMVAAAKAAQEEFQSWPEDKVDALLYAAAAAIAARALELAAATVEETTIGNADDKAFKIQFASLGVYDSLVGKTGLGQISESPERKVRELASPVGVIFGLVPLTNPVPTFINKTLISLKGRNAIILSCHRMAQGVAGTAEEIIREVLEQHGAPQGLVQSVRGRTSRHRTAKFMRHDDVAMILATGGPGMVHAAYSAGKPAIGVGAGNAPAFVTSDADVSRAARAVVSSKTLDNGLICGAEQHLVVDGSVHHAFIDAIEEEGAVVLDESQTRSLVEKCFDEHGHLRIELVGRSAETIAQAAGIEVESGAALLVFPALTDLPEETFGRERLAPVLSLFVVDGEQEGFALCKRVLSYEGAGHTAVIHTEDPERRDRFAADMPVSRILVNAPAALGCCGAITGLRPSLTLGCGTFGRNSTTDNVSYDNLLNVKRVAEALM